MTPSGLEDAILAVLRIADERDGALVDRIVDQYLRRFGDDAEAKHAALRRLTTALMEDGAAAAPVAAARAKR